MNEELFYRNVTSAVRTPRFAVLVDKNEKYWRASVNGIVHSFSQVWGGEHFIIVPTDGKTIAEPFWNILEAYSPDIIGRHILSFEDMKSAEPERYAQIKEKYRLEWKLSDEEFEDTWASQTESNSIGGIDIDQDLSEALKNRLSPFHRGDHIVSENVFSNSPLGYPFTQIEHIVESAKDRPFEVVAPMHIEDDAYRLLALSRAGALSVQYGDTLKNKGFSISALSSSVASFRLQDYLTALDANEYNPGLDRAIRESFGEDINGYPREDFLSLLPFRLSMLHLGRFYRRDIHKDWKEDIHVIVGDTMEDYCIYYNLSRLHEGVYWLPDSHLRDAHRRHVANLKADEEHRHPWTENEAIAAALVYEYVRRIGYGHKSKRIKLSSASLSSHQLTYRKKWMIEVCFTPTELRTHCDILPLGNISFDCIMQTIELNNHANQQDMVFQNRHSIGSLDTPKPKNFDPVDPSEHRWITSINIDGFYPPALPFLGEKIIEARHNDTRVASDGLAYFSPNVGYFGGDIDYVTVRPGINLMNDESIFTEYFSDSRYSTELSDKGSYLKDTVNRFGSLEKTAAFFRSEAKRNLFGQFLFTKENRDSEVIFLEVEQRSYLSFEAFKRKLADEDEAIAIIDELIAKEVISRGFIFQCSRCRLSAWYDVSVVNNEFTCNRCGLHQPYYHQNWKSPSEPRWYYRLAETVYLFYKNSSHLTVLALDKLRQEAPEGFHYISETNILNPHSDRPKQEIDVLAIVKGGIVLGECKDCPVAVSDIRKYLAIFSQLNIKPAQFLLVTSEKDITSAVRAELSKFKNYRVFVRADLYDA